MVVTEAGLHGTPTVAFASAGGPNDSIRHGHTGVLVHGGQGEFTAALRALLFDDVRRMRLSANVAGWVRRFRWEDSVDRWDDLVRRAVLR